MNSPICASCWRTLEPVAPGVWTCKRKACPLLALPQPAPGVAGGDRRGPRYRVQRRMRRVIIESPYRGVPRAVEYALAAMADCLRRGEAPFASHVLYTQPGVLDDEIHEERALGIRAGLHWGLAADLTVVYTDLGVTPGMRQGIASAERWRRPVQLRTLPGWTLERG